MQMAVYSKRFPLRNMPGFYTFEACSAGQAVSARCDAGDYVQLFYTDEISPIAPKVEHQLWIGLTGDPFPAAMMICGRYLGNVRNSDQRLYHVIYAGTR